MQRRAAWRLTTTTVVALAACAPAWAAIAPKRLASGLWGGDHVQLDVAASEARIEFDCGRGRISEPFVLAPDGRFDLIGTYTREGGPTRKDEELTPVRYKGALKGKTLTLSIEWSDGEGRTAGPFDLERGRKVQLRKCR